ncbi:hypothetical protein CBOM_05722 [Ceraceosorus bombacis]|uniref:Uncharacterized protein n=1 Tax=Ceraceosorus bombacis TaxID=401625 RepID=A0A0P1BST9_9BASI|nr:hypothetical protein CBOM_05722 [Ceraceosorus bombacis]
MRPSTQPAAPQRKIYLWHINYATQMVDEREKARIEMRNQTKPTQVRIYSWHRIYATNAANKGETACIKEEKNCKEACLKKEAEKVAKDFMKSPSEHFQEEINKLEKEQKEEDADDSE